MRLTLVSDHHAFVQRFEKASDLLEPFRFFDGSTRFLRGAWAQSCYGI